MKTKYISSKEVALRAGVSQATVSYVLNDRKDQPISAVTRKRVLDAALELKYRPNRLVNGLLRRKTGAIGLIASWLDSAFHAGIMRGVQDILESAGYHTFISWAKPDPTAQAREVDLLLEHRVDGIIYISEGHHPHEHADAWLRGIVQNEHLPCVVIDNRTYADFVDCVVSDDISGAQQVVAHLVCLGHRRIAFWGRNWGSSSFADRFEGYKVGLKAADIAFDTALCPLFPSNERRTAIELHALLKLPDPATAIFLPLDVHAMLARQAAEDTGVSVPDDLAIVGYSNQEYSILNDITSVSQNNREMGKAAARLLMTRFNEPDRPATVEVLPTELVVRGSTVHQPKANRFDWPCDL